MPRKLPPFCEAWRDRHGKIRVYFRRGKGRRIPLPERVGSDEFIAAYQAALVDEVVVKPKAGAAADAPGTIGAVITSYMRSPLTSGSGPRRRRATVRESKRCATIMAAAQSPA